MFWISFFFLANVILGEHQITKRSLAGFETVEVVDNGKKSCLYISTGTQWPYRYHPIDTTSEENIAAFTCENNGLKLAEISNPAEHQALLELTRCSMSIGKAKVLVKSGLGGTHTEKCVFQLEDGTYEGSDGINCAKNFKEDEGDEHDEVFYVCKKEKACTEFVGCHDVINDVCHMEIPKKHEIQQKWNDANDICKMLGGALPKITTQGELDMMKKFRQDPNGSPKNIWVSLATKKDSPKACNSIQSCILTNDDWKWKGFPGKSDTALSKEQESLFGGIQVNAGQKCMEFTSHYYALKDIIQSRDCSGPLKNLLVCVKIADFKLKINAVPPDHNFGTFTCPTDSYPEVPEGTLMQVGADQPELMCPGKKVGYECNAGGINVRQDKTTTSTFEIECLDDQSYKEVPEWPQCVDRLDCPPPEFDDLIMNSTWADGDSLTPPFTVDFSCKYPKKQILSKEDLAKFRATAMMPTLIVTCHENGTYDKNPLDYTCTNPCQPPSNPDPDRIEHDWTEISTNLEINEEVKYKCKDVAGRPRQLVRKNAFEAGDANTFYDDLMSNCQVRGALNETIGSFTCTRPCGPPTNYSEVFVLDWDEEGSGQLNGDIIFSTDDEGSGDGSGSGGGDIFHEDVIVEIGYVVKYSCVDPTRKVVSLMDDNEGIYDVLDVECLFNGRYSTDIKQWDCTDCLPRPNPPNSKLVCESKKFEHGSTCMLQCDPGYIPLGKTLMTCMGLDWDIQENEFRCIEPIGLVIGGIAKNYDYLNEVEVLAPGFDCTEQKPFEPYPHQVIGASGGFVLGQNIVCGGAIKTYVECTKHTEGSFTCDRNVECVQTAGGSEWCTGPKTKNCYSYDFIQKSWNKVAELKTARAYAGSVVMPDGTIWIMGGIGRKSVLKTTEILQFKNNKWVVKKGIKLKGPMMGHCVATVDPWTILVVGGFSPETADYIDQAYFLDTKTNEWYTKPWSKLKYGKIMDSSCTLIHWNDNKHIIISSGWNNSFLVTTELFDDSTLRFNEVEKKSEEVQYMPALPYSMRSSVMGELNGKPILAGGVICENTNKNSCERSDKILTLVQPQVSNYTDGTDAHWEVSKTLKLKQPKSSHTLLLVPRTYASKCKLVN